MRANLRGLQARSFSKSYIHRSADRDAGYPYARFACLVLVAAEFRPAANIFPVMT